MEQQQEQEEERLRAGRRRGRDPPALHPPHRDQPSPELLHDLALVRRTFDRSSEHLIQTYRCRRRQKFLQKKFQQKKKKAAAEPQLPPLPPPPPPAWTPLLLHPHTGAAAPPPPAAGERGAVASEAGPGTPRDGLQRTGVPVGLLGVGQTLIRTYARTKSY